MSDPVIFGTETDRTGVAGIVRRAGADIGRRFAGLAGDAVKAFDAVPRYALNAADVLYGFTDQQMQSLAAELQAAVDRWLLSGQDEWAFWYDRYSTDAMQAGAAQSAAGLGAISETYAATRSIEHIIYSRPYQLRLGMAKFKSYEHWTGLATQQKTALAQLIGQAVVDGKNPRDVVAGIKASLEVTESKARQYAQTDITDTLRMSKVSETEETEKTMGLRVGLLWSSALSPTTRPWHASRHGKVYSPDEVKAFYEQGGNRYNCLCGVTQCLLDESGKPILSEKAKARMAAAKARWDSNNPA